MTLLNNAVTGAVILASDVNQLINIVEGPTWINTMSPKYGAVGNGASDDTTALAAALADIPTATGGVLFTPPNYTHLITGLDISSYSNNLIIMGGGWSSCWKLKNGANSYLIKSTSGSMQGARICNLKLDCNGANQTAASGGIHGYKYRRCLIDFCYILNPWQAGIYLIGTNGDFGYQNRICNNFIIGGSNVSSGVNAYGNGLRLEYTDENTVYANHFENNGNFNDSTYGCHIYDQNGLTAYTDNSFVNGYGVIKLDGLQCVIKGNRFDGNGRYSVQCNGSATNTIITDNILLNIGFRATGGSANTIDGIYLNATQCIVANNWMQAAGGSFAYTRSFVNIDTGATYSQVMGNEFNVQASSGTVTPIYYPGAVPTGSRVRFNNGYDNSATAQIYVTENHGTATILNGNTSVTVNHGLSSTPTVEQILLTPQNNLGTRTVWVSSVTSTQFTITITSAPPSNYLVSWWAATGW